MEAEKPKSTMPRRIVVIGSSVAKGSRAASGKGWASLLGQELHRRGHGREYVLRNVSIGGANTTKTIDRFPKVVPPQKPDIVIIALSLMNEGILEKGMEAYESFNNGVLQLIQMAKDLNCTTILGGVYPSNLYNPAQYDMLKQMQEEMKSWGYVYLDFLSAVDDGQGHWKEGTAADPNHPNDLGHRLMYESIPIEEVFGLAPVATGQPQQEKRKTDKSGGKGRGRGNQKEISRNQRVTPGL